MKVIGAISSGSLRQEIQVPFQIALITRLFVPKMSRVLWSYLIRDNAKTLTRATKTATLRSNIYSISPPQIQVLYNLVFCVASGTSPASGRMPSLADCPQPIHTLIKKL